MTIDIQKYNRVLEEMLLGLEGLKSWDKPEVLRILTPMFEVMHIAKFWWVYYPNRRAEAERTGRDTSLYEAGEPDMNRPYISREENPGGSIIIYYFYSDKAMPEWDAEDLEKLHVIEKVIFSYHGRVRLVNLVEERTYTDYQINTRNTSFVMRLVGQLLAKKEIFDYGLVCFNLKGFSLVNSRVGRDAGTMVMSRFVQQLNENLEKPGVVGRMGGDNFVGIFRRSDLDKIRTHLSGTGITYNDETGEKVNISAVAGYYMPEERDEINNPDDLMDRVTMAVHVARHVHDVMELFYSAEMQEKQTEHKRIERLFPDALVRNEFKVYYQPKINITEYSLAGAEALCRWVKDGEVIPPGAFIPVLEQSMNICLLDFYMLEHVCCDLRRWLDQGRKPVRVSVNLSRKHLGDMNLVEHIIDIIDRNNVPHGLIEIELTETTTDVEFADLKRVVNSLQERGICTSVDDFGTGYSSLNLIKEISWNVLKLDKAFLPVMAQSAFTNDNIMLRHVVAMAIDMGLECIVEGVETCEQVGLLMENNCYLAQGYYFDRPLPVYEFEDRLDKQKEIYCKEGKREL